MSARLLTGKEVAETMYEELREKVKLLDPLLAVVQVGDNPASSTYIKQKIKCCDDIGMRHKHIHLPESTSITALMETINQLNTDDACTGFFVQLPLPEHLSEYTPKINRAINPQKDIDGFGAYNLGKMFLSPAFEDLPPATPSGIIKLLEYYDVAIEGKHAVIVGRSNIVGKPLAIMLLNRGATVTVCHSKTDDLGSITSQGDILCVAVGKANLITKDMVKPGAVVIDAGTNTIDGKLHGDVDFDEVKEVASAITPMPGGVGPMTIACLLRNVVRAAQRLS